MQYERASGAARADAPDRCDGERGICAPCGAATGRAARRRCGICSGSSAFIRRQSVLQNRRAFFQARRIDPNHFEVERIMTDLDEEPGMASDTAQCIPEPAVGDLPVTLVFEIGRMTTPLSKLADLQTGDVLETTFETAPDVGIRAQGKLIAS